MRRRRARASSPAAASASARPSTIEPSRLVEHREQQPAVARAPPGADRAGSAPSRAARPRHRPARRGCGRTDRPPGSAAGRTSADGTAAATANAAFDETIRPTTKTTSSTTISCQSPLPTSSESPSLSATPSRMPSTDSATRIGRASREKPSELIVTRHREDRDRVSEPPVRDRVRGRDRDQDLHDRRQRVARPAEPADPDVEPTTHPPLEAVELRRRSTRSVIGSAADGAEPRAAAGRWPRRRRRSAR